MIRTLTFFSTCLMLSSALASPKYEMRGFLSTKALKYTADARETSGQRHRAQFEHLATYNETVSLLNQARWNYSSVYQDLSNSPALQKEDTHDFYAGENYLKLQSADWVMQLGYQEISWGESFGFNYADLVNPEDQTETAYADADESKLPLLLINTKYFFTDGSLQLLYSPEPKFSKMLPLSLFTNTLIPGFQINVLTEKSPSLFKENEYGGKLSLTKGGFDLSVFGFSSLDRSPFYELVSATATSITVREQHSRIKSYGASMAKTLFDDFVLRSDVVLQTDKTYNTLLSSAFGPILSAVQSDELNSLISIDTPTYSQFSGALIYAASTIKEVPAGVQMLREKNVNYGIGKISYDFGGEKILDFSYTREFSKNAQAVQAQLNWAINSNFDFRVGGEHYWGEAGSNLGRLKNISNIYFSIKNYFQL